MEDSLQNPLWPLQVPDDAFWINQHIGHFLRLYQQDPGKEVQYFYYCVP